MPDQTPADVLRAAATKLNELASRTTGSGNPWRLAKGIPNDSVRTAVGWEIAYGSDTGDLRYIAAMHPGVGSALADWLEEEAHRYDAAVTAADNVFHDDPAGRDAFLTTGPGTPSENALTVARQILGTQDTR